MWRIKLYMQSSDFLKSNAFITRLNKILKDTKADDYTDDQLKNMISNILLDTFNDGIISNITERKKVSEQTLQKKSKEVTGFLPAHFKNSEVGKKLLSTIQSDIIANTTDYVLNVGYEPVLDESINNALQIAYSVGITTGFEISSDPDMKSIYTANVERFMKSGIPGNN